MAFFGQMSVIYWVRNTKSETELVFRKHYILSPQAGRFLVIGQAGKILIQNIDIKFCPSLNWTLFCYGRTRFLLLHLAIRVQARHLTSTLHRRTTQQHRLHCTVQPTVIRQHVLLTLSTIINYYTN